MRKYCLRLIIASCLTPSSNALGMDADLGAAQFETPEKPHVEAATSEATAFSACPSSVSVRSTTRLDSPSIDTVSTPLLFCAALGPIKTIHDMSKMKALLPFLSPKELINLKSASSIFALDFEDSAHLSDVKLWGNDKFWRRVQGDEADTASLRFLVKQFYSEKSKPDQHFKIARRVYPYTTGSKRDDVEKALEKGFKEGDHFFKTAALLIKYSENVDEKYKDYLTRTYKDTTGPTEHRIEAARFLAPFLEDDDRQALTEFLMETFYSIMETPAIKMLAGRAALKLVYPAGKHAIQSYWEQISNDRSNHRSERTLAHKFLLKYGNDEQKLNLSTRYMTSFFLSHEGNVPLLK